MARQSRRTVDGVHCDNDNTWRRVLHARSMYSDAQAMAIEKSSMHSSVGT